MLLFFNHSAAQKNKNLENQILTTEKLDSKVKLDMKIASTLNAIIFSSPEPKAHR